MRSIITACLALSLLLAGCEGETLKPPVNELVVVRGYLQANMPFSGLNISSTLDLGSPDTVGPPVRDAVVHIIRGETCYELIHRGKGDYSSPTNPYTPDCPDCGLVLTAGDTINLEVFHFGKVATASTVIPPQPHNLTMASSSVVTPPATGGAPTGDAFEISWELEGEYWFYLEFSRIGGTHLPVDGGDVFFGYVPTRKTELISTRRFVVTWDMLPYYGHWRVNVVAVSREYVELYLTRNQDSRDLNEPVSNVTNGLGIFTAINSDRLEFDVVDSAP
jgi:Domain of unknown function (DUF4249)